MLIAVPTALFFATVTDVYKGSDDVPMTYKYFHEVIKGKAPKMHLLTGRKNPSQKSSMFARFADMFMTGILLRNRMIMCVRFVQHQRRF